MTNDERNRKFAESFEPMPTLTAEWLVNRRYDSPGRMWTLHRHSNHPIEDLRSYYWQPRDFTAPEGVLMLLEKLISIDDVSLWTWSYGKGDEYHVEVCWGPNDGSEHAIDSADTLAEAVNQAYERWLGRA